MKLGIFDSGIGGETVARSLKKAFPDAEILVVNDREHLPYGSRTQTDIIRLTEAAIKPLLDTECDIIVIACNTATAAAIETLRERYPEQLFIGLEPMVKPAVKLTRTGVICVCATPATLGSKRYKLLKEAYGQNVTILEPDCSDWAQLIENNDINESSIEQTANAACDQGADVIVLACTHYHWIRETVETSAGKSVIVLDPSEAIAERVRQLLERR